MATSRWEFIDEVAPAKPSESKNMKSRWEFIDENPSNKESLEQQAVYEDEFPRESGLYKLARIPATTAINAVAGAAEYPRGIADFAQGIVGLGAQGIEKVVDFLDTPERNEAHEKYKQQEEERTGKPYDRETIAEKALGKIGSYLPSSENIKETVGKILPEGFLKPQNDYEKALYDTAQTVGSLILPGSGATKGKALKRAIASGIGGEAAKALITNITGSEAAGNAVKAGTIMGINYGMNPPWKTVATDKHYDPGIKLGEGLNLPINPQKQAFAYLNRELVKHARGGQPANEYIRNKIIPELKPWLTSKPYREGKKVIFPKQTISFPDFVGLKQSMNEYRQFIPPGAGRNSFDEFVKNALVEPVKRWATGDFSVQGYGRHIFKNSKIVEAAKKIVGGDQIWSAIHSANPVVEKIKENKLLSSLPAASSFLLPYGLGYGLTKSTLGGGAFPAAIGGGELFRRASNFMKYPAVKNETLKLFKSAAAGNTTAMGKAATSLNKELSDRGWNSEDMPPLEYILEQ